MSTTYTVGVEIKGNASGMARAAKEAQAHVKQMGTGMGQEFSRLAKAREQLGIRPEREIQRELMRTEAAYNRLARSGTMSFNDQRRAAAAMRDEVTKLTKEMGKLTTKQKATRAFAIGSGVAVAGGVAAAYAVPKFQKAMSYDETLAHMANTSYAGRDTKGRLAGRDELDAKINAAVKHGGGTRDGAVDALKTLVASGQFDDSKIGTLLNAAQFSAKANDANSVDFANMAIASNKNLGISPERMANVFGMGTYIGQNGQFEIKDMAKWLPQQSAAAKQVGLYGESGFAKLAAVNQAARGTAGTNDEAGNNVVNLLAKLGSQDTAKDFKKMGINLPQKLAEGRMRGEDAFDVVGGLLEQQLSKDKNFQNVKKQLALSKNDDERTQALNAVGNIAQGSVVGKVFQDRQALMGLLGYLFEKDKTNKLAKDAPANDAADQRNMAVVSQTASYKVQAVEMARDAATQKTMDKMLPAIGAMADGLLAVTEKYPGYTTAIGLAVAGLTTLAGAAGLATLAMRGGGVPSLPGGPGGSGKAGVSGAAGGAGKFAQMLKLLGPMGMLFALEGISDEDIAKAKSWDAKKAAAEGHRGKGFNDPRLVGASGGADRAAAFEQSLRVTEVKGEITVRVNAPPGFGVDTTVASSNPRIPMKSLGQTNLAAGS